MITLILVVHALLAVAMIGVIMIQRSEGGGLGMGGGGGMSGFMTGRGAANLLTRTTSILAGLFMLTSIGLAWLAGSQREPNSVIDRISTTAPQTLPTTPIPGGGAAAPVTGTAAGSGAPNAPTQSGRAHRSRPRPVSAAAKTPSTGNSPSASTPSSSSSGSSSSGQFRRRPPRRRLPRRRQLPRHLRRRPLRPSRPRRRPAASRGRHRRRRRARPPRNKAVGFRPPAKKRPTTG